MRCFNCGWENPDTNEKCVKCNAPLAVSSDNDPVEEKQQSLRGTVAETDVFNDEKKGSEKYCARCGFPLRNDNKACPQCGYDSSPVVKQSAPETMSENVRRKQGTINPWANQYTGKAFSLKPLAWDGDSSQFEDIIYDGDSVDLNRENTESGNHTITSKVQARIEYAAGEWTIQDQSEQKTTFIYAGNKLSLHDGDIIMLGNRRFLFKEVK